MIDMKITTDPKVVEAARVALESASWGRPKDSVIATTLTATNAGWEFRLVKARMGTSVQASGLGTNAELGLALRLSTADAEKAFLKAVQK